MNKHLEELIELSKIDQAIDAFEPRIAEARAKLAEVEEQESGVEREILELEEDIRDAELKKAKNDLHIQELTDKLDANKKKSAEAKTEKEIKALQLEEEIAREQLDFAHEEIGRLENLIETRNEEIETKKAELAALQEKSALLKEEVEKELAEIEKEKQEFFKKKQELVSKMSQKILAFYDKIRRWAKNTAVVPVRKQACMGCFMKINDKTYAEVIKGEEITTCPHCGRILYLEVQKEEETAE
ncbi:C4-type zinc ribbon domain-containing protein [Hydrogenimonas sp.]|uniref:zinc ribbon domain-containing protein n=1 Tax=Hydrogenimonas sp. TaxID=2231112 RepID=UPI0026143FB8|nr:C4-type zinc ribbon domain-containing protein [Hydrogenimonas sp.]